jgi:hypothetical protein
MLVARSDPPDLNPVYPLPTLVRPASPTHTLPVAQPPDAHARVDGLPHGSQLRPRVVAPAAQDASSVATAPGTRFTAPSASDECVS